MKIELRKRHDNTFMHEIPITISALLPVLVSSDKEIDNFLGTIGAQFINGVIDALRAINGYDRHTSRALLKPSIKIGESLNATIYLTEWETE